MQFLKPNPGDLPNKIRYFGIRVRIYESPFTKFTIDQDFQAIASLNIIIATPGRLCQHLDQTYGFNLDNLLMFVLDEADRMLDMGFKNELDQIVSFLPQKRYEFQKTRLAHINF